MLYFSIEVNGSYSYSVVKKANVILRGINRSVICKIQEVIVSLYAAMMRSQLEYCVQF